ncbi:MAG: hypothetical protein IVW57_09885 [Ktedonobacterales bacterium]|nr:hypothetical protein [Ktedonobacterales bacterium]
MGEMSGGIKLLFGVLGIGLLLLLMAKGMPNSYMANTLGGTGEVLFFAGLGVLLLAKK